MRTGYIIYNERPSSGLLRTQVISLLKEIKKQAPEIDIRLLAFWQPWVSRKYRDQLRSMRAELGKAGIIEEDYPLAIIPSRYFMYKSTLFPILHAWASLLFRFPLRRHFDIIHCRGYFPSLIAAELKHKYDYRLIFDMRSLWPKEHISIGGWNKDDDICILWEKIERYTIKKADATVVVSSPMLKEIEYAASDTIKTMIPICVDTHKFNFDENAREKLRYRLKWEKKRIIVYQGSLGLLNRNIYEVAEYFKFILNMFPDIHFLILTSNRRVDIGHIMKEFNIKASKYSVIHPNHEDLPKWLSVADAGIHAMSPGPDSHTRLSAKIVEYLSCGLPIIVNAYVGAAAKLAETYHVGTIIDLEKKEKGKRSLEWVFNESKNLRKRCRRVAEELFSVQSSARKYIELYKSLVR